MIFQIKRHCRLQDRQCLLTIMEKLAVASFASFPACISEFRSSADNGACRLRSRCSLSDACPRAEPKRLSASTLRRSSRRYTRAEEAEYPAPSGNSDSSSGSRCRQRRRRRIAASRPCGARRFPHPRAGARPRPSLRCRQAAPCRTCRLK